MGWAIQKGHKIAYMEQYQNYMPSIVGVVQEGLSIVIAKKYMRTEASSSNNSRTSSSSNNTTSSSGGNSSKSTGSISSSVQCSQTLCAWSLRISTPTRSLLQMVCMSSRSISRTTAIGRALSLMSPTSLPLLPPPSATRTTTRLPRQHIHVFCVHTCSAFWKGAAHVMLCMLRCMCSERTVLCYHSCMHRLAPACGTVER